MPRRDAVAAYLHERAGDLDEAAELYAEAATAATSAAERDHLTRQAARLNREADPGSAPPEGYVRDAAVMRPGRSGTNPPVGGG